MRRFPVGSFRRRALDGRAGVSLVEAMIAVVLLAFMTVGVVSALNQSSRATRVNSNAVAAKNIAQGYFERMAIDSFTNVGRTGYTDVEYNSDPPVWLDEGLDIRCRVRFEFKGFGTAEGGGSTSLTDSDADWAVNEWRGDTLYLVDGMGGGQFASITGNTQHALTLGNALGVPVDAATKYMINNGKTIEITTTWQYRGKEYSQTIESLVVNYRGEELGF